LQAALAPAMKARDKSAVAALRGALAAIANAEAVAAPAGTAPPVGSGPIAGAVTGLGPGEVERRELTDTDVVAIVEHEIADRIAHADNYEQLGRAADAAELRAQAEALRVVSGPVPRAARALRPKPR
jgi:hypothetical protein